MKKAPFFLSLFAGIIIILISIYGFFLLRQRPGLPPIDKLFPERQLEMNIKNIIQEENLKIQINGIDVKRVTDLEFIMSQKTIGVKRKKLNSFLTIPRCPFPLSISL